MFIEKNNFVDFSFDLCLKHILDNLQLDEKYWKGKTWNETIQFRRITILSNYSDFNKVNEILNWGGIYGFKNHQNIENAFVNLKINQFAKSTLDRISSYSKLFSFHNPDQYFILDARVAFSLNCLLIGYSDLKSENNSQKPDLINFNFKSKSRNTFIKDKSDIFIQFPKLKEIPYQEYNSMILKIYNHPLCQEILEIKKLNKSSIPEIIEMILFKYCEEIYYSCQLDKYQGVVRPNRK
jgi:hypothetical protein